MQSECTQNRDHNVTPVAMSKQRPHYIHVELQIDATIITHGTAHNQNKTKQNLMPQDFHMQCNNKTIHYNDNIV